MANETGGSTVGRDMPYGLDLSQVVFDRVTRLAKHLMGADEALIILIENGVAWRSRNPDGRMYGPKDPAAERVIATGELLWIGDARVDADFCNEPLVKGTPFLRSYVAAPIRLDDGSSPGVLCAVSLQVKPYERSKADRLQDLADLVADEWVRAKAARARDQAVHELESALRAAERSEERLNMALALSDVHVWEIDYVRRQLFKAGAEDTFFETPQTYEGLYRDIFVTIDPRDHALVREAWRRHVEEGEPYRPHYRIARTDGKEVWVEGIVRYFADEHGRPERMVGALRNITAAKRAERNLLAAIEAAEAANAAKSQFVATISHEIRTPLNGVLGMAQAMESGELTAAQRARLGVIRESGQGLVAILNDVLDISKIEAGKLELAEADFDLQEVAESARDAFAAIAESKGLSLTLDVAPAARALYLGDAMRVRQILCNLISNALKFTERGGVSVRARRRGGWLWLSVADSGIGVASAELGRLFEEFEQADASITSRLGGTGLGLAICRRLAELMGGRIRARSRVGEGATFTVALPLTWRGPAQAPWPPATAPVPAPLSDLRVLAAEDNAVNQLVLKALLGQVGVEPIIVGDGVAVVDAWARESWDVILLDIQMPLMDGPAAARHIRRREAELGRTRTPIVALTANALAHQVEEYSAAGMDAFVAKPIEVAKLFAALSQVIDKPEDAQSGEVPLAANS